MKTEKIESYNALEGIIAIHDRIFLLIYKEGAELSECALSRIEKLNSESDEIVFTVNVSTVRDIHEKYNITTVPVLLELDEGRMKNIYKGCQMEDFYLNVFSGTGFSSTAILDVTRNKRVVVYTSPTCTWCNTIKTYLTANNIRFTEVDVSSNPSKAEEMVRKSGHQGVPQTEIDGQIIVGFDKKRINELLEIS